MATSSNFRFDDEQLMPPPLCALSGSVWDIPITVVGNDFGTIAENTKRNTNLVGNTLLEWSYV